MPYYGPAFQLSQSSLQDFVDCPRRFQLRHIMEQDWPAPPAEPLQDAERADRLGKQFHLVLERHWLDLPVQRDQIEPPLLPWWDAFVQHPPQDLPGTVRRPEIYTSAVVHGQRMVATFDLLAYEPGGSAVIVDWKTSRRKPPRTWLDRRMQTLIYPLLLVESSPRLLGYALKPEQVRLIYWFTSAPTEVELFQYTTARHQDDQRALAALLDRLLAMDSDSVWPLTPNAALCRLCQYRSLCDRGREAGSLDEEYVEPGALVETAAPDDFVL
jgi:CRISPR/Cas system-associated exonuclease Cas4 (RecB family)